MVSRVCLARKAQKGDRKAQFELGCSFDFLPPKNRKRAVYWYRMAAEKGHSEAQNFLAECLRDGTATRTSLKEAANWFLCSAKQGCPDAQLSLGCALYYGKGIKKNRGEALQWYRKASRQGLGGAQLNIGQYVS